LINMDALQLGWFDRWLKDDRTAGRLRGRVRLFFMGANTWRSEDEWPLARATDRQLFLHSQGRADVAPEDGTLDWAEPRAEPADRFVYDPLRPVPTTGGAHLVLESLFPQGPIDQGAIEARPDVLTYSSDPLEQDIEVTGWVALRLWVDSSAPCTDFTARLVDVHADGRAMSVCDGIRRVDLRRLATAQGAAPFLVEIELGATAQNFKSGHRIRLDISSSNFPRFDLNPNTGERSYSATGVVPATQSVFHEGGHPSHLVLPVVG
jgi:putative CocE/NonD family hydrolase